MRLSTSQKLAAWSVVDASGCHIWQRSKGNKGYGLVRHDGKMRQAHRVAWTLARGQIPPATMVCHKCDVPACVNVGHLFLGDNSANMRDKESKGRGNHPVGARHGRAKLTEEQALRIYLAPKSEGAALARGFGVDGSVASAIRRGIRWKHLHSTMMEQP